MLTVVPKFLSPAVCEEYTARRWATPYRERRGQSLVHDQPAVDVLGELFGDLLGEVIREGRRLMPYQWPLSLDYAAYTVMFPGAKHVLHADAFTLDGQRNHTPERVMTAMLYLTSDGGGHDGGAIVFPALGLRLRPVAGTLLVFGTGLEERHQVEEVTAGERHALACWFKLADMSDYRTGGAKSRLEN